MQSKKHVKSPSWSILSSKFEESSDTDLIDLFNDLPLVYKRIHNFFSESNRTFMQDIGEDPSGNNQNTVSILSDFWSVFQIFCSGVNLLKLDYFLNGANELAQDLDRLHARLSNINGILKDILVSCGRKPPQDHLRKILLTRYEKVSADGAVARAVRSLRQIEKGLGFLNDILKLSRWYSLFMN